MKRLALILLAGFSFAAFSSCNSDTAETETTTETTTTTTETTTETEVSTETVAATTALSFDKMEHDFGDISDQGPVETTFTLTNSGNEPLLISEAKGSCGCTVPEYPTEPVAPGESRDMKVSFNPSGKEGAQNKTVTIIANTNPQTTVLNIKANVIKSTPAQ